MNLSKAACYFLCVLVFWSCQSTTSVPSEVIQLDSMKALMWHIAEAEAYANQHIARDSAKNLRNETNVLYQKVFALHKISKEQFAESLKYYETHPEIHKILLDSLVIYANRIKDSSMKTQYGTPSAK